MSKIDYQEFDRVKHDANGKLYDDALGGLVFFAECLDYAEKELCEMLGEELSLDCMQKDCEALYNLAAEATKALQIDDTTFQKDIERNHVMLREAIKNGMSYSDIYKEKASHYGQLAGWCFADIFSAYLLNEAGYDLSQCRGHCFIGRS